MRTYREHKAFYDKLQRDVAKAAGSAVDPDAALANVAVSPRLNAIVKRFNPAVILISGCQDNQTSMDGDHNGAFTEQLLKVWNNGAFSGNYAQFHKQIRRGHAGRPVAEPVRARRGGQVPRPDAVHRLSPWPSPAARARCGAFVVSTSRSAPGATGTSLGPWPVPRRSAGTRLPRNARRRRA